MSCMSSSSPTSATLEGRYGGLRYALPPECLRAGVRGWELGRGPLTCFVRDHSSRHSPGTTWLGHIRGLESMGGCSVIYGARDE